MPTNLPPEYHEAEKKFKSAVTPAEKADALEELISTIPKHKGTDKLRADYRKRLSKFKTAAQSKKNTGKHESPFKIEKEGDGRAVIIGCANTGKSSLVSELTHAEPDISASPFSTWSPTPGMLVYKEVHVQLIDTPAIERDYIEPEFVDLIKHADIIVVLLDLQEYPLKQYESTIELMSKIKLEDYSSVIWVVNKCDLSEHITEFEVLQELLEGESCGCIPISVKSKFNINMLLDTILGKLDIIRVYSKEPHSEPDHSNPYILKNGSSIEEFAATVHKDFVENFKSARIWGKNVYAGQMVGKEHILFDGDIVELHI